MSLFSLVLLRRQLRATVITLYLQYREKMQLKMSGNYVLDTLLFLKVFGSRYLDQLMCDNDPSECC